MRIIKLNAIDSTNSYLKRLCNTEYLDDFTVVRTNNQTKGRGQMGSAWESKASKNLTFSVFKNCSDLKLEQPFYLNMVVCLAMVKALSSLSIPRLSVKWPNDILSANKKVCGVLIENVIKNNLVTGTILGIGLNVNQIEFENLPKASSLKKISGCHFNLDQLTIEIVETLKTYFVLLEQNRYDVLKSDYEKHLFRKSKPSTFKSIEGHTFSGFIKGVSDSGKLQVLLEDKILKAFDLKQITLLY